jgi:SAM-dependent methyltransferase
VDRDEWNRRYASVPLLWAVDPGPFLGQEVGGMPPGRALDLGSGEGRNAIWLAQHGWKVTGVDFSEVAVGRAADLAEEAGVSGAVTWVVADLASYEPARDAFDLVLLMFVHLAAGQRAGLLERAVGALAPGGTILVVGYDTANATEGDGGVRDPAILFSPDDIVAELGGLEVERAEQLRVGNAVDAIVRASRAYAR